MNSPVFNIADVIWLRQLKDLISKRYYFRFNLLLIIPIVLNLLVSYQLPAHANNLPANEKLNQAMISMNAAMSDASTTGNSDVDFALMMIPHHQGAVDMAKVELKYGTDPRLRRLAQEIIVTQQSEVALMLLVLEHPLSTQSSSSP
jgi:hypothetical protein